MIIIIVIIIIIIIIKQTTIENKWHHYPDLSHSIILSGHKKPTTIKAETLNIFCNITIYSEIKSYFSTVLPAPYLPATIQTPTTSPQLPFTEKKEREKKNQNNTINI